MRKKIVLWLCILMLCAPLAAESFLVKEWERSYSTEEQNEVIQCCDVGDLDNDGSLEIVVGMSVRAVAGTQRHAVYVLDDKGNRKFKWDSTYPINNVFIADINKDSLSEIIVSGADLYVLSHKALNLNYPTVGTVVFSAVAADLDEDGNQEIVVGTREVTCMSDTVPWTAPIGSQVKKITISDINWDGAVEVVVLTIQNVHVFDAEGNRLWVSPGMQNLLDMTVANIDEDRQEEIFFSTDNRKILIWEARENGLQKEINLLSFNANFMEVEDLNKDGQPELIVASDLLRLEILDMEGTLLEEYRFQRKEARDKFAAMLVCDLDKDQWMDVVLAHSVNSLSATLDSYLYFMKNQSFLTPPPDRGTELYNSALALFNEGNCADAVPKFIEARDAFLEEENQGMASTCEDYIEQCEKLAAQEEANSTFSEAEAQFQDGSYERALELYEEAETQFRELGDTEKAQLCSQRISEIQDLLSPSETPEELPEEEESNSKIVLLGVIVIIVAAGLFGIIRYRKPRIQAVTEEIPEEPEELQEAEEEPEEEALEKIVPSEEILEEERKLKAQFVYGEINREEYREKLRKLYGVED